MTKRFAEIDSNNKVLRVVVCESADWLVNRLGGTWIETQKYAPETEQFAGIGMGCDVSFPEKFAPDWVMPSPDPVTGVWSSYPKGQLVWHAGQMWRSTCDGNVWEPGVSAWHPYSDIEGVLPNWVQPTGAHDAYPLGFEVEHEGQAWVSDHAANVWEPGVSQWHLRDAPQGASWIDTGATVAQLVGAGVYRASTPIPGLTVGQALKLGDQETVFNGYWSGFQDYLLITPHVSAAVGATVWRWG